MTMGRALSSELLKLRTTRTFFALVGSSLGLVALIVGIAAATGDWSGPRETPPGEELLEIAGLPQLFAVVLGILAVTSEFRHGTITPSLLVTPDRVRFVASKLVVNVVAGLVLGVLSVVLTVALAGLVFSLRDIDSGLSGSTIFGDGAGIALSMALYAGLGVGLGAIVRNQVGAIVGTLAYIFVIESLLTIIPGVDDVVEKYGLNGVTSGLAPSDFGGDNLLAQVPAGLLLTAYVAAFVVVGAVLLRRRDVSA